MIKAIFTIVLIIGLFLFAADTTVTFSPFKVSCKSLPIAIGIVVVVIGIGIIQYHTGITQYKRGVNDTLELVKKEIDEITSYLNSREQQPASGDTTSEERS